MAERQHPILYILARDKSRCIKKTFPVHGCEQKGWACLTVEADWTLGGFKKHKNTESDAPARNRMVVSGVYV